MHGYRESNIIGIQTIINIFGNKDTEELYHNGWSRKTRQFPHDIVNAALRKLDMMEAAYELFDLRSPPANRLEALNGKFAGLHSIRINRQWRITFKWHDGCAHNVLITDYH